MLRKLPDDFGFDEHEDQALFTRAMVAADPYAADLLPLTDTWLGKIDAARMLDRAGREATMGASALRVVANAYLDGECRAAGRDLAHDLNNDRSGVRWTRIFPTTVDAFISQPLAEQATACQAWLTTDEPVIAARREALSRWSTAAQTAIATTKASAQVRGTALLARESLAEEMTRARDGLARALAARAEEHGLPRDYVERFFLKDRRKSKPEISE